MNRGSLFVAACVFAVSSLSFAIDEANEHHITVAQGSTVLIPYATLATNAINPQGTARVTSFPIVPTDERQGEFSIDQIGVTYHSPTNYLGDDFLHYRLQDDAGSMTARIRITVVEQQHEQKEQGESETE